MSNKNTTVTTNNGATSADAAPMSQPTSTPVTDGLVAQLEARRKKLLGAKVSGTKGVYQGVMKSCFETTGKGYARQTLSALLAAGKAGISASLEHDEDFESFSEQVWVAGENFAKRHLASAEKVSGSIAAGFAEDDTQA